MTGLEGEELDGFTFSKVPLIEYNRSYEVYWYVKYLSWQGYVLNEFETPYEYKSHPFSLLLYPLVDGEVWGFVEDIIDQQRYINRLITLLDFIIGSSSKGVLLVPEDSISDDFDINSIAQEWTKFNGVIKIKLKNGAAPPIQMATKSTNIGINELLAYQLKFLSEVSGVSGAVQGQDGNLNQHLFMHKKRRIARLILRITLKPLMHSEKRETGKCLRLRFSFTIRKDN